MKNHHYKMMVLLFFLELTIGRSTFSILNLSGMVIITHPKNINFLLLKTLSSVIMLNGSNLNAHLCSFTF